MLTLSNLKAPKNSRKTKKRLGRGRSSGKGKTSGRGQKGQLSRSGGGKGPAFEGGQTPLQMRVPKLPGFKNHFRKNYEIVNLSSLNIFNSGEVVTPEKLLEKKLVRKKSLPVKILGDGELEKKLVVKAAKFSKKAKEAIETKGGKTEIVK
jgi:large subunit ribosomal protein L15